MYIINEQDFQRQYSLPNNQGRTQEGSDSQATQFIDGYARLFLKDALGTTLFNELDSHITDGVLDDSAPQKWLDLVNGKDYTIDSKDKTWKGLIYNDGAFTNSVLIPFVYYHWLLNELSTMTSLGEKVLNAKNAVNTNSTQRLTQAWNDFVQMNQRKEYHNQAKYSIVNGVPFTDWFGGNEGVNVCLIEYLEDNKEDYPDANMRTYRVKNQFGL